MNRFAPRSGENEGRSPARPSSRIPCGFEGIIGGTTANPVDRRGSARVTKVIASSQVHARKRASHRFFYNTNVKTWDVIIIGGGIIGLSLAIELRRQGAKVLVVERGEPGREASHAAGGMLVDCPLESPSAMQPLANASARLYPEVARELELESGLKVDLRDPGTILLPSEHNHGYAHHPALRPLSAAELSELEPALAPLDAAFYINERSVDPRALTAAAVATAKNRSVDFSSGDAVTAINLADGHVTGVTTVKTTFHAAKVVNCAGAWSGQIAPHNFPTRPVKGQMLCLLAPSRALLQHVVRGPDAYLIPRSDWRIIVGTTVEEAGFDKRVELAAIQRLHQAAVALVPELKNAKILEDWAGLRPGTPDNLPLLGESSTPGYYAATGHL